MIDIKVEPCEEISNQSDSSNEDSVEPPPLHRFEHMGLGHQHASGILQYATTFITLEGLSSGVPTRTTPTLTPTTLRSIEQTFIELQSKSEPHENEAGFVPPLVHSIGNNQYIPASEADSMIYPCKNGGTQSLWHTATPSILSHSSSDSTGTRMSTSPLQPLPPMSLSPANLPSLIHPKPSPNSSSSSTCSSSNGGGRSGGRSSGGTTGRRNTGGRKPTKDSNVSPEEEERRRIRRERNKAAAARCRKRRVDHTNALIIETEGLERKRQSLREELQDLQALQEELEFMLESHRNADQCRVNTCSPPDIKPYLQDDVILEDVKMNVVSTMDTLPVTANHNVMLSGASTTCGTHTRVTTPAIITTSSSFSVPTTLTNVPCSAASLIAAPPSSLAGKRILLNNNRANNNPLLSNSNGLNAINHNNIQNNHQLPHQRHHLHYGNEKPHRPNFLNVPNGCPTSISNINIASVMVNGLKGSNDLGVPINTPSTGIQFNFDSLMVGGTGLTPVTAPLVPSCSTQQRHQPVNVTDVSSPDTCGPPKLVSL